MIVLPVACIVKARAFAGVLPIGGPVRRGMPDDHFAGGAGRAWCLAG